MDELLEALSEERDIYEQLAPISERKTKVLIKEDLEELKKITDEEQLLVDKVSIIDRKREKVIKNISGFKQRSKGIGFGNTRNYTVQAA